MDIISGYWQGVFYGTFHFHSTTGTMAAPLMCVVCFGMDDKFHWRPSTDGHFNSVMPLASFERSLDSHSEISQHATHTTGTGIHNEDRQYQSRWVASCLSVRPVVCVCVCVGGCVCGWLETRISLKQGFAYMGYIFIYAPTCWLALLALLAYTL